MPGIINISVIGSQSALVLDKFRQGFLEGDQLQAQDGLTKCCAVGHMKRELIPGSQKYLEPGSEEYLALGIKSTLTVYEDNMEPKVKHLPVQMEEHVDTFWLVRLVTGHEANAKSVLVIAAANLDEHNQILSNLQNRGEEFLASFQESICTNRDPEFDNEDFNFPLRGRHQKNQVVGSDQANGVNNIDEKVAEALGSILEEAAWRALHEQGDEAGPEEGHEAGDELDAEGNDADVGVGSDDDLENSMQQLRM